MRVLGLGVGNPGGSAEILLSIALSAAEREGAEAALVRLHDLSLPTRPVGPASDAGDDDGAWRWDELMESDGLIVATPIYSRTIAGVRAGRRSSERAGRRRGVRRESPQDAFGRRDPTGRVPIRRARVPSARGRLHRRGWIGRPRVEGAGPAAHAPDDVPSQIAVADQLLVGGAGMPRSVVLDECALAGASRVGRSVGISLGARSTRSRFTVSPGCARCVTCPSWW